MMVILYRILHHRSLLYYITYYIILVYAILQAISHMNSWYMGRIGIPPSRLIKSVQAVQKQSHMMSYMKQYAIFSNIMAYLHGVLHRHPFHITLLWHWQIRHEGSISGPDIEDRYCSSWMKLAKGSSGSARAGAPTMLQISIIVRFLRAEVVLFFLLLQIAR